MCRIFIRRSLTAVSVCRVCQKVSVLTRTQEYCFVSSDDFSVLELEPSLMYRKPIDSDDDASGRCRSDERSHRAIVLPSRRLLDSRTSTWTRDPASCGQRRIGLRNTSTSLSAQWRARPRRRRNVEGDERTFATTSGAVDFRRRIWVVVCCCRLDDRSDRHLVCRLGVLPASASSLR